MAATTALREALNQGISSGNFVDTKIILYSYRGSSGRVGRPKVLYTNSHVLKSVPYFNNLLFGNFAESQPKDFNKEAVNEQEYAEDYGYLSDSDLEDDEDTKDVPVTVPTKGQKGPCEDRDECVEKGKIVRIPDVAFVTFQAFLLYLYTGAIEFAPFGSNGNRRSRTSEVVTLSAEKIPWPSPKSIYRLADKYDVPALKLLAFDRIRRGLGKCDIVEESFSKFASQYDQIRNLYVSQLASVWIEGSTQTIRASFDEKIDSFAAGELEHVAEMLSSLWDIINKPDDIAAPSNIPSPESGRAVTSPANWTAVNTALIKSIRKGVFFDRKYWVRYSKAGSVSRPIYFSSIVMGDKTQRLNNLVIRLGDRNALVGYLRGDTNVESDCEGDSTGPGDGALELDEEKEEHAHAVLTTGSFSAWKSLFFYHCTDVISFAPLKSQGVEARWNYIRGKKGAATPPPCSPKSIYVLASLLGIPPLCDRALTDIKSKLSSNNIVDEIFSSVTASQRIIIDMQCDLLVSSFKNPQTATVMKKNIGHASDGSSPYCAGALKLGFNKALEARKREGDVLLRCSNISCQWSKKPFSCHSSARSDGCCPNGNRRGHYTMCAGCGYRRTDGDPSCRGCKKRFA